MGELKFYKAPRLEPLNVGGFTKHSVIDISAASALQGDQDVSDLLAEFGSPLYIVSEDVLREQFRIFDRAFQSSGIRTQVAYSYKTNYLPAVCNILHDEGAIAEVVSGMEYSLARSLGVAGEDIIFNGPYKTREELQRAFAEGALVNIDGFDELDLVADVARTLDRPARIGIRVNFQYGATPWTKFGFNDENGDSQRALELVSKLDNVSFESIHNHCGTFQLDTKIYARAAAVLIGVAKRARGLGLKPRIVDFGGGFPSTNALKPFYTGGLSIAEDNYLSPYAEAILNPICAAKQLFGDEPMLVLEPGRAVVDTAMELACTVVATKQIPVGRSAVVVDAGVNLIPTAYWYDHPVQPVQPVASAEDADTGMLKRVSIFGPLCMQIDVVREEAVLPPLTVGTPLVFSNVGAYCLSQSMQFIQTRPAVVLIGPNGPEVIRRREEWRDVFGLDEVPERLRRDGHSF